MLERSHAHLYLAKSLGDAAFIHNVRPERTKAMRLKRRAPAAQKTHGIAERHDANADSFYDMSGAAEAFTTADARSIDDN